MRMLAYSKRVSKEILRDPTTLFFGLGFPIVLLVLLTAIQSSIPVSLFEIDALTPGICIFGLSFMSLFTATLISKDRESALLQRLYTTPMTALDFLGAYAIPIIPISVAQSAVTFASGLCLGLDFSVGIVYSLMFIIPISLLYISIGMICGSLLGVKAVGGICGGMLTNLAAWLSGTWFDIELIGGAFEGIAKSLPFFHAVKLEQAVFAGDFSGAMPHFAVVMAWTVLLCAIAVFCFLRQMKRQ